MPVGSDWETLTAEAPEKAAEAILEALDEGDADEAREGLEYLRRTLAMNYKHALKSQLIRLMTHVLKWQAQPERRSGSWAGSIVNARTEIAFIQEDKPSLNRAFVESAWERCALNAARQAAAEMGLSAKSLAERAQKLSWDDVFEAEYRLSKAAEEQ